jgi:hypothetical protein
MSKGKHGSVEAEEKLASASMLGKGDGVVFAELVAVLSHRLGASHGVYRRRDCRERAWFWGLYGRDSLLRTRLGETSRTR